MIGRELTQVCVGILISSFINVATAQESFKTEISFQKHFTVSQTDIISFLANSKEHSVLLNLLKHSELDELFTTSSSFTVFAPTNAAFEKLPKELVKTFLSSENRQQLISVLKLHIVEGEINSASISKEIEDNNGETDLKTKHGHVLRIFNQSGILTIEDGKGQEALIETPDKQQTNGFVHIIDSVLLPE